MWVKLEDIMLGEMSQDTKGQNKYCMIPLYEVLRIVKFIETESGTVLTRAWGEREREFLFNEPFSLGW